MVLLPFTKTAVDELRERILGEVFVPGDAGYDEHRQAWNLTVEQHPAVIVLPEGAADVVEAVKFANQADLGIAVQATGHGVSRPADNALLIITSGLNQVHINVEDQTAWVGAGNKWGPVLEKAQQFGLAPLLGSTTDVGVVGYTLGGGMGWLARKYGLSADSVNYFEVVTADGRQLHVSKDENSDLFWALRGGGGSFGIITGLEIKLYPVSTVFGGNLLYPAAMAKEVFTRYREWIADLPEEFTTSILLMNFPPIPQVPDFLRGQSFVIVRGVYAGDVKKGEALLQPWLDWQQPVANMFRVMPFSEVDTVSNDPKDPSAGVTTSVWLKNLSDDVVDTLIHYGVSVNGSSPIIVSEVRYAGGAVSREQNAAYGNRDASLVLELISIAPTPEAQQAVKGYFEQVKTELAPHSTGGVYINFLEGEEKWNHTKDAYSPETYRRLTVLKAKYDPENRFHYSFNIPPMKGAY
jgi:FAD/FMN-containing dehydrogenase